jgi:high mobility group protein B1
MSTFLQINNLFIGFLNNMNVDSDIIEEWENYQEELNKIITEIESKKKNKKPKDAPKNPKSAYAFFCSEKRGEVKEENINLTAKEITAKLGEMWKQIKNTPDAEKYEQLALNDKDRYKEEMENYVPSDSESVVLEKGKKTRAKKPKDAPKNVRSAYMFFCQETRGSVKEQFPTLASKEITVKLGEMWQQVKDTEDAKKFHELSSADKNRYKEEMENYVPSDTESVVSEKGKKTRAKKPKDAPKNVRSAYMYFCQETRGSVKEEFPTLASKEITVKLGEMWQQIKDSEEAKKFHELSKNDKNRYREEMDNYVPSDSDSESVKSEKIKKVKKPRTKKPKNAPKSSRSAYIFFCHETRPKIKEEFPEMEATLVTSKLGEMWKEIKDTEEAKKFHELSKEDKIRYTNEMEKYSNSSSEEDDDEDEPLPIKKKSAKKD